MRKTVEEEYGHREVELMGMDQLQTECDTTEAARRKEVAQRSTETAVKATQMAMAT